MKKSKVGRPKLADKELKKKSYIMLGVSALLIMILLSGTLVSLNILSKFNRTKGSVPIYKTYAQGDMFCLNGEEECFYTISDNGDTVTGLAKYNLLVGYEISEYVYDNYDDWYQPVLKTIDSSVEGYGLQNKNAKGLMTFEGTETGILNDDTKAIGTINFATGHSWGYWVNSNNYSIYEKYGTSYPTYVFDENSNLWEVIQDYKSYLNKVLDIASVEVSLMSYEQAQSLGCTLENGCDNALSWVYSSSYWLGSAKNNDDIFIIDPIDYINYYDYATDNIPGLRPVITISKNDLLGESEPETTTTVATTTKKEEATTVATAAATNPETTTTKKKVVRRVTTTTTTLENKVEETTTTTKVNNINKVVSTTKIEEDKKKSVPVVPIAVGCTAVIAGIGYGIYLLKIK